MTCSPWRYSPDSPTPVPHSVAPPSPSNGTPSSPPPNSYPISPATTAHCLLPIPCLRSSGSSLPPLESATTGSTSIDGPNIDSYEFSPSFNHNLRLDSTCGEFLLYSSSVESCRRDFFIYNVVTTQYHAVPKLPLEELTGNGALVCHPDSTLACYVYRVLYICFFPRDGVQQYYSTIFNSETGRWSELALAPRLLRTSDVVAARGLLFWLDEFDFKRLVIFDAFAESWRYVAMPADLLLPNQFYKGLVVELSSPREAAQYRVRKDRLRVGLVQGQLRLGQVFRVVEGEGGSGGGSFIMKIWELKIHDEEAPWRLVHEVKLIAPVAHAEWMYVFSFDPEDSDAIFLCCDSEAYRYRMSVGDYAKVLELKCAEGKGDESINKLLPRFSNVFILSHPIWPTVLPSAI